MSPSTNLPENWRDEWARELAEPPTESHRGTEFSVLVFRLGDEWFSVLSSSVVEVTPIPAIHRVPHRGAGLVNVRGRVTVCADLGDLLGPLGGSAKPEPRLVVLRHGNWNFATVVDAVDGVHRISSADLAPPPPPNAARHFTVDLWFLGGRSVARLDESRLFSAVKDSLA